MELTVNVCCGSLQVIVFHSGASGMGLMPFISFFLFNGELLLLFRVPTTSWRDTSGTDERTSGGCFVAVHEIHGIEDP